jgi:hypothetical protein
LGHVPARFLQLLDHVHIIDVLRGLYPIITAEFEQFAGIPYEKPANLLSSTIHQSFNLFRTLEALLMIVQGPFSRETSFRKYPDMGEARDFFGISPL